MRPRTPLLALLSLLATAGTAFASAPAGFGLEVLVDGAARPEYPARGTVYVEALRGRDFSLRITNPLGVRVAVALSVDGLNTIDARRTSAQDARKWILAPYQSVVIPGWQVSGDTSRKFYFTGEKRSYGAALGQTANLGTIEAVFFREKLPYRARIQEKISANERERGKDEERISSNEKRDGRPDAPGAGSPLDARLPEPRQQAAAPPETLAEAGARDHSQKSSSSGGAGAKGQLAQNEPSGTARDHSQKSSSSSSSSLSDELAATGIGRRTRFEVTRVDLDLEESPAMSVRLRYEFRPQLVALGVLREARDPIARREAGRGFSDICPEPD